ncbi:MAG: hypothetical protein K2X77_12060 [Candidatus Obscuribacterales bacterium]|nr:hypothetical protein [Candidatus Obscuribacterales bacterium]
MLESPKIDLPSISAPSGDSFSALHADSLFSAPEARSFTPAEMPMRPASVSESSWAQIQQWTSAGTEINYVTASSGTVPDYILGADGNLTKNPAKTAPSPDGSVTVQVDNAAGQQAAAKAASELKVATIQSQIAYWQRANPKATDIPGHFKAALHSAQSEGAAIASKAPEKTPTPQQQSQPQGDMPAPTPSTGRPSFGGPGSERVGGSNIGNGGYRPGNFEPLGPSDRSVVPPPVAGDLPIKGPPTSTPEQIQEFLTKIGSPAAKEEGFAQALHKACTDRGIDPSVAVGFFLQESTCGRYGRGHNNLSLGNIKGVSPESGQTDGTFRRYNSWAEGARDWARLIDESYVGKRGLQTLSQVISVYAPGSDNNNERGYVATVKGVVEGFKKQNGGTAVA